jgi:membrane-associated protein
MHDIIEFVKHIINPAWIIHHGGLYLLMLIIFAETGLFVGFFLPGDSLLFVSGMVAAQPDNPFNIPFSIVIALVAIAGILGNFAGYWFGKKSGPLLFKKEDTFFFKKKHLIAAHEFYEKHGGSAIIFARFLPFIRTFAPIVGGIVEMDFKKFSLFNMIGSVAWVCLMMVGGYFLGLSFPWLGDHLEIIVVGIVVITTAPVLIRVFFGKRKTSIPE